jgi:glutathione S-transferase
MTPVLTIGNRNYSSWSLRPWLCLKWAGVAFDEHRVELDQPGYGEDGIADVLAVSPTGKVPVLRLGDTTIWDSLAIAEWAAEQGAARSGAARLLPEDALRRAQVRSACAEMHAGFSAVRRDLSMNIRRRCTATGLPADTLRDIARIERLWSGLRAAHGARGPWLFGERTMADAFHLPLATRFRTYGIALSPPSAAYAATLLGDTALRQWEDALLAEPARPFTRAPIDALYGPPAASG